MDAGMQAPTRPWLAVVLSFLCTGLGQIYCRRPIRGLALLGASTASLPAVLCLARAEPSKLALLALLVALLFVVGIYLFAVGDAYWLARRQGGRPVACGLNHPVAYGLLVLFGLGFPVASTALIRSSALQAFKVAGTSMTPTLAPGDHFLAHREIVGGLKRGDIIVFHPVGKDDLVYVRRVVALAGDSFPPDAVGLPKVVPSGHCFVLGDRRTNTYDSPQRSLVPLSRILGRVHYVYYPPARFGVLQGR